MIRSFQTGPRRRGAVAVLVAVSLTALLIVLAIALDGGLLFTERRHAQATADAAAMAGAAALYKYYSTNHGADNNGAAVSSALSIASSNGYTNDGKTSTVVGRTSGQTYFSGPTAGKTISPGYVEATATYNNPRHFSRILASATIP